ncbi:MAG: ABC transporter ATP-binding protein [Candidatus Hermodarchaeota archaeon]|nr:ABC transporter ATP-binding protein [Candidatus Hermodarchaeota archaeon]
MPNIMEIENLKTYFYTEAGVVKALDGVSFNIEEDVTHGLVGESGSGKTVTALSVLGIVPSPGKIVEGTVMYNGENLLEKSDKQMQKLRGNEIAISFQDPSTSLNPLFTIGSQIQEVIMRHQDLTKEEAHKAVLDILEAVRISEAEQRYYEYPHQFSTGMRQRIAIARALSARPKILFADEPTTALDVTIEAQVLNLMRELQKNFGMDLVMITHDMGVIAEMCKRVTVLYAGRVCETSEVRSIFHEPLHPYTAALLTSVPSVLGRIKRLAVIPGTIPDLIYPPSGCRFHPRCKYAKDICKQKMPDAVEIKKGHKSACLRIDEIKDELLAQLIKAREEMESE